MKGLTRRQAARRAGVKVEMIDALVRTGSLAPDHRGRIALIELAEKFPALKVEADEPPQA